MTVVVGRLLFASTFPSGVARKAALPIRVATSTATAVSFSALSSTQTPSSAATPSTKSTTQSHEIKSRLLSGIHPLHLFRIVQDVDKYHEFLPFCGHSEVFRDTVADGGRSFRAELAVGFGPFSFLQTRYLSRVVVDAETLTITTKSGKSTNTNSNSSMFDSLTSLWKLRPVVETNTKSKSNTKSNTNSASPSVVVIGTSVDFFVEMTVSDPVVEAVLNKVLVQMAEKQVQAFEERCHALPSPTQTELLRAEAFFDTTTTKATTK